MKTWKAFAKTFLILAIASLFTVIWISASLAQPDNDERQQLRRPEHRMMDHSRSAPESGTMGMIDDDDDYGPGGRGKMGGNMGGMQDMMMSHMMSGRGGMDNMMGRMGSGMRCPRFGPHGFKKMASMLNDLDLTPEQWDQVRSLARTKLDSMADLWAARMKLRLDLMSLHWEEDVDPQQVRDLFRKQAEIKADMVLGGIDYLKQIKSILNEDQLEKLEQKGF